MSKQQTGESGVFNFDNPDAKFGITPDSVLNLKEPAKQNAVDWFLKELLDKGYIKRLPVTEYQQALRIFKKQIEEAWKDGEDYTSGTVDPETFFDRNYGVQKG